MNEVYAVLDIGSASIELLVGEIINSNLHVLFSKIGRASCRERV